jgi:RNA polymerase sigma-70 factor (ECF subfamily)
MTRPQNNYAEMEDLQLLQKAKLNDMQALAQIHDRFYQPIWRYVNYRINDSQVCEDIVSEVFLRFISYFKKPSSKIENLKGWLLGTANHLVMDHWRVVYKKPQENLDDHIEKLIQIDQEKNTDQSHQLQDIREIIGELTVDQQHVLTLRFSQDMSLEETAEIMNKSLGSVKLLQHRAVKSLRVHMKKRGWE